MSHPDLAPSPAAFHPVEGDALGDDPFTAVSYHFGMLLGVDDFETESAYHRGRDRLHQAWLHGPGVVWGLAVRLDVERGELRVEPGLAVDGAGRNVHLDAAACLDPAAWFEEHESEVTLSEPPPEGAQLAFDAHLTARFASCLTRPVPALAEPCAGADVETAYSRIWETIDLRLVPGPAPEPADRFRRLRILFGLLEPGDGADDEDAAHARATVLAATGSDRTAAALSALRAMANADAAQLAPPAGDGGARLLTPGAPSEPVVLATIRDLALARDGEALELHGGTVELVSRRSHIATATIQELAAAALAGAPAPPGAPSVTGATLTGTELVLALSAPLDERTVQPDAFSVTALEASGWADVAIASLGYDPAAPSVTLSLDAEPAAPWQVIARGTGPRPLVGESPLVALGGGQDFVHIQGS